MISLLYFLALHASTTARLMTSEFPRKKKTSLEGHMLRSGKLFGCVSCSHYFVSSLRHCFQVRRKMSDGGEMQDAPLANIPSALRRFFILSLEDLLGG